jgi:integrase
MAEPKKTAQGTWRVMIEVRGVRDSKTLPTRREAIEWRDRRVMELRQAAVAPPVPPGDAHTLRQVLRRYADEVTPAKRGNAKESVRLRAFEQQFVGIDTPISKLTTADLAAWRDARLKINARGSVLRDISLLSAVLETARREWGYIATNPMADVRKPAQPDHRERVIAPWEVRRMLRALGHQVRPPHTVRTVAQAVAMAFLAALATGMRAGELCGLRWADVHATHCHLPLTKNGSYRDVPLSPVAVRLLQRMRGWDNALVFGLTSQTLDAMFRKYRQRAGLDGFTFHDARHTAATRMAKKLHVLELCKVFGWRRMDQALTYFNAPAADLARKLA